MKKISLICGMLLALASSVYAYDNDYTHKISTEHLLKFAEKNSPQPILMNNMKSLFS